MREESAFPWIEGAGEVEADGRSRTVAQEGGDACTDGCGVRDWRMFHIDAGFATAPNF